MGREERDIRRMVSITTEFPGEGDIVEICGHKTDFILHVRIRPISYSTKVLATECSDPRLG